MKSQNISIRPVDKRCHFWAFVLRKDTPLPVPAMVDSYHTMPGVKSPLGDDEIFAGTVNIGKGVTFAHYGECAKKPGVDYLHENHTPCQQFKPFE